MIPVPILEFELEPSTKLRIEPELRTKKLTFVSDLFVYINKSLLLDNILNGDGI